MLEKVKLREISTFLFFWSYDACSCSISLYFNFATNWDWNERKREESVNWNFSGWLIFLSRTNSFAILTNQLTVKFWTDYHSRIRLFIIMDREIVASWSLRDCNRLCSGDCDDDFTQSAPFGCFILCKLAYVWNTGWFFNRLFSQ